MPTNGARSVLKIAKGITEGYRDYDDGVVGAELMPEKGMVGQILAAFADPQGADDDRPDPLRPGRRQPAGRGHVRETASGRAMRCAEMG
jgi:hypothetical protein